MEALWHIDNNTSALRPVSIRLGDSITLQSKYSMISTGTERKVALGQVSNSFINKMSVPYMEGDFNLPIKYGYSLVGTDEHGDSFHVMHPHQYQVQVSKSHVFKIPVDLSIARAALISNMETIINGIWDADLKDDDTVAICGFGNIGSLLSITLKDKYGIDPKIIEIKEWNKSKAESLGFTIDQDDEYDIIFHTSGSSPGLQHCIDHLLPEGKVIELSWYGDQKVELHLGGRFHYDRLQIISSQVSTIPKAYQDKFDYQSRKSLAASLLTNPRYDDLISDYIPFQQTPLFFNDLRNSRQGDGLIYLIEY